VLQAAGSGGANNTGLGSHPSVQDSGGHKRLCPRPTVRPSPAGWIRYFSPPRTTTILSTHPYPFDIRVWLWCTNGDVISLDEIRKPKRQQKAGDTSRQKKAPVTYTHTHTHTHAPPPSSSLCVVSAVQREKSELFLVCRKLTLGGTRSRGDGSKSRQT
jgi:hypothetical protein